MAEHHPFVSERQEGRPWFEWCVAGCTVLAALLALYGYTMAATVVLSVTAIGTGVVRLVLRGASPWKIRSVAFDAACGIGAGVGLLLLYGTILMLVR
ncbi:MAG: DUF3017 domain-containing protein [Bifidobacterium sp.]|nr:DUF3017 domain-containing protein [Bifidobacterium sp.]